MKKKFKRPSLDEATAAIGLDPLVRPYIPDEDLFHPVPEPNCIDDWLAQYEEDPQCVSEFLSNTPWISLRKRKNIRMAFNPQGKNMAQRMPEGKIYLVPVGEEMEKQEFLPELTKYCSIFYGLPVTTIPGVMLESDAEKNLYWAAHAATNPKRNVGKAKLVVRRDDASGKRQLDVTSALDELKRMLPDDAFVLVGLTMEDLYDEDDNLFVAGMAAGNARVAIFSFARYDPCLRFDIGYWWKQKTVKMAAVTRKRMMLERACKLLVHEVAHLLGVEHCVYFECLMNGSGHLEEDFRQPMHLCPVDLRKLQLLCGFDVIERYQKLLAFYQDHGMKEAEWIQTRLSRLVVENRIENGVENDVGNNSKKRPRKK